MISENDPSVVEFAGIGTVKLDDPLKHFQKPYPSWSDFPLT
jgi:hypothetical protein